MLDFLRNWWLDWWDVERCMRKEDRRLADQEAEWGRQFARAVRQVRREMSERR